MDLCVQIMTEDFCKVSRGLELVAQDPGARSGSLVMSVDRLGLMRPVPQPPRCGFWKDVALKMGEPPFWGVLNF